MKLHLLALVLLPLVSATAAPRWRELARAGVAEARQERAGRAFRLLAEALRVAPEAASQARVLTVIGKVARRAGDQRRVAWARKRLRDLRGSRAREVASPAVAEARDSSRVAPAPAVVPGMEDAEVEAAVLAGLESDDPGFQLEALATLEKLSEAGDPIAAERLGELYLDDGLVSRDTVLARRHLERAAAGGRGWAAYRLAVLLRRQGSPAEEVSRWVARAAAAGVPQAGYEVALEVMATPGALEDPVRAERVRGLLQVAALAEHPGAQYSLAVCLGRGIGGLPQPEEAWAWMRRAAKAGHPSAQLVVGAEGAAEPTPGSQAD